MDRLSRWLATVGGLGYLHLAPGTLGALVGLGLGWLLTPATATTAWWPVSVAYGAVLVIGTLAGVAACGRFAKHLRRADPPQAVVDETIGMLWTMCGWPRDARAWVIGFALFRLFDITKPWLIRRCEQLPRGWGIMMDDVAAGVLANLVLRLAWHWWPW